MSGFMQLITDRHHACGLAGEIDRECGRAAGKWADRGIQFSAAIRQIHVGDGEVSGAENGDSRKKKTVLPVPETVLARRLGQE